MAFNAASSHTCTVRRLAGIGGGGGENVPNSCCGSFKLPWGADFAGGFFQWPGCASTAPPSTQRTACGSPFMLDACQCMHACMRMRKRRVEHAAPPSAPPQLSSLTRTLSHLGQRKLGAVSPPRAFEARHIRCEVHLGSGDLATRRRQLSARQHKLRYLQAPCTQLSALFAGGVCSRAQAEERMPRQG